MNGSAHSLKSTLSKLNYTAGGVVSLLRVLEHALRNEPHEGDVIMGCHDLAIKIIEEAEKVNSGLDKAAMSLSFSETGEECDLMEGGIDE